MRKFKIWEEGCKVEEETTYFKLMYGPFTTVCMLIVDASTGEPIEDGPCVMLITQDGEAILPEKVNEDSGLELDEDGCLAKF